MNEISNMNKMNKMTNMSNENHGGLYTSQAAESYLRFPATASPCSNWLPCQAEAVYFGCVLTGVFW